MCKGNGVALQHSSHQQKLEPQPQIHLRSIVADRFFRRWLREGQQRGEKWQQSRPGSLGKRDIETCRTWEKVADVHRMIYGS